MSNTYNPKVIEPKWQQIWSEEKAFAATDDYSKPKYYALVEFPYPSGQGLHVGHPRPYTAMDIVSRKRRMQGYNVLFPMGWDAFGLPTENYAIKNQIHPKIVTENNVAHFKKQLQSLGYSFDWDREINTTDSHYYKWTQWIFLKLFNAGLAYKTKMPINFCTSCKVGLANEEVVNGVCERCGAPVIRKMQSQWMLKITEYADKLIDDLDDLDFIEKRYVVSFKKDARNLLYGYCADTKHGGLGTCIEILKTTFNRIRPEWISISVHLAYSEDTMNYFPDSFRLRDPDDDLSCYSANAVHIDKEEIERLKPVEISSSLIRSVSKYQIVI